MKRTILIASIVFITAIAAWSASSVAVAAASSRRLAYSSTVRPSRAARSAASTMRRLLTASSR